jgi:invasion protein IalB
MGDETTAAVLAAAAAKSAADPAADPAAKASTLALETVARAAALATTADAWCVVCQGRSPADRSTRPYCSAPCRQRADRGRRREAA